MTAQGNHNPYQEGVDFLKLKSVVNHHVGWIIAVFVVTHLSAYLVIRYTNDLYESVSELKLDIKKDAAELGIQTLVEDQNLNIISGEIEQIKSRLFFNRVIDSCDLDVSYISKGNVLNFEMYRSSPFRVQAGSPPLSLQDRPIYIDFPSPDTYRLTIKETGETTSGAFGEPVKLMDHTLIITRVTEIKPDDPNTYFFILNSRPRLLDYLSGNITVEPLNYNANTIRITFKDNNPLKAHDLVNALDSLYLQYSNEQKNLANKQKLEWVNNELRSIEEKMQGFENYFENFTIRNKSTNADDDLKRTIGMIHQLDSQRFALTSRLAEVERVMDHFAQQEYSLSLSARQALPDYLQRNVIRLEELDLEHQRIGLTHNESTFAFRQKEKELQALRQTVLDQTSDLKSDLLTSLQEINQRKSRLESQFANLPDKNTEYSKNQRFYKLYEEFYLSLMQSRSQFEIAQAGNTPDFKILSPASFPERPISPDKAMIMGIGTVAGIVLNFFLIGILYLLNNKVAGLQELERLSPVPVLGHIPFFASNGNALHVTEHPKSRVSESIRAIRTNLDFFTAGAAARVITITSTVSGEGKSFIAMNLGGVMALSRKKVILLDLDMRKPKSDHALPGTNNERGVSTILIRKSAWKESIVASGLENLDFLPSGPHPPNPSELLLNGEFSNLLESLKQEYDLVLLDTPPAGLVTDAVMAMKKSDLSIYVVRANYSRREFLHTLRRLVSINKLDKVTVLLNAVPVSGKQAHGYGYYHEEGRKESLFRT
jgi:capsular exopolysaccharide synthesis family protein